MRERLVSPIGDDDDESLRPRRLADYVGQAPVKEQLAIAIAAARARGEALEHVLLHGPPGLGKTTLSRIIANELGAQIKNTSGPAIEHQGALASMLMNLGPRDVLFVDEIHRLNRVVEESLYPAMEDFMLDIVSGRGTGAQVLRLPLKQFTLIGATTRAALLTGPLRDRFGLTFRLEFYDLEAIQQLLERAARVYKVTMEDLGAVEIARRSRRTPRVALRLLRRVRDYAQVMADGIITLEVAREALDALGIDHLGLDEMDRRILELILTRFKGGPAGLATIAASVGEEPDTIEDVYEPYLLQIGFLHKTQRGRLASEEAARHLNLPYHGHGQQQRLL
ncbi:MAG TPA: Holliday junction branch migration DNA helicase RuvB [Chloroflexota bacterium]|jgi:Holliday junction DNA helicase RuvB|nr:Holliday junction branch migration DNA helicase RuvB [Chloroflexota bacterium]